ncbi:MAG: peptidase M16 [Acidimicrobiales bacterium]|nr:MAG: peptidase M16 [Acidimicrobiales bacterium]
MWTQRKDEEVARSVLPSGARVVTDRMTEANSVCIGFWVGVGSRDEPAPTAGISHFLEHLIFKGTESRSARQIAEEVDAVGGEMNAFTTREYTAYHIRVPAGRFEFAMDLMCEVLTEPAFRAEEVEAERSVIVEEILLSNDTPDDLVVSLLYQNAFPSHPLGREILGSLDTVRSVQREHVDEFFRTSYTPSNLVVAVAGRIDHDAVCAALEPRLEGLPVGGRPVRRAPDGFARGVHVKSKETDQVHLAIGWPGVPNRDEDRYAVAVFNHLFGGGTSSRLFQEIREDRGLAYSIWSQHASFADAGLLSVYVGTAPERVGEVLEIVAGVVGDLLERGCKPRERDVAVGFLEGSLLLSLEESGGRMGRLGVDETLRGEVVPLSEHVERLRSVDLDDVARVAARILSAEPVVACVGPIEADDPMFEEFAEALSQTA